MSELGDGEFVENNHRLAASGSFSIQAAGAEKVSFYIASQGGKGPPFAVTDAIISKVGVRSWPALLSGLDDAMHQTKGPLGCGLIAMAGLSGKIVHAVALDDCEVEIAAERTDCRA